MLCEVCDNPLNRGKRFCSNKCRAQIVTKAVNAKRKTAYPWNGKERQAYYTHKFNAINKRDIEWSFTFESWLKTWHDSGKWEQRGRRTGQYVMSRFNDAGPYSPDNVQIVTSEENHRECVNVTRPHTRIDRQNGHNN